MFGWFGTGGDAGVLVHTEGGFNFFYVPKPAATKYFLYTSHPQHLQQTRKTCYARRFLLKINAQAEIYQNYAKHITDSANGKMGGMTVSKKRQDRDDKAGNLCHDESQSI